MRIYNLEFLHFRNLKFEIILRKPIGLVDDLYHSTHFLEILDNIGIKEGDIFLLDFLDLYFLGLHQFYFYYVSNQILFL